MVRLQVMFVFTFFLFQSITTVVSKSLSRPRTQASQVKIQKRAKHNVPLQRG